MDEHEARMIYLVNQNHRYRTEILPYLETMEAFKRLAKLSENRKKNRRGRR